MENNFDECLRLVLKSEGGWVDGNKIGDPGGETNLGVTKRVWEEWVVHEVKTMKDLTPEDVAPMYKAKYWMSTYANQLPKGLDFLCFSMGVNAGPGRAVKLLQQSVGCIPDGIIGVRTIAQITNSNINELIEKYSKQRGDYYISLNKPQFIDGWLHRVTNEKAEALSMING